MFPSPKFQLQLVSPAPVERSVNVTDKGAIPVSGVPVKFAVGIALAPTENSMQRNKGIRMKRLETLPCLCSPDCFIEISDFSVMKIRPFV